jgi:hypothetical protein
MAASLDVTEKYKDEDDDQHQAEPSIEAVAEPITRAAAEICDPSKQEDHKKNDQYQTHHNFPSNAFA